MFRAPLVPTPDVPNLAMDRYGRIYYNPETIESWEPQYVATVMLHEMLHYLSKHFERVGTREPQRWNIAADMETAELIRELDYRAARTGLCVFPETYGLPSNLSAEEYYDMLQNNAWNDENDNRNNPLSGSASDGLPKPWELPLAHPQYPGIDSTELEITRREVVHAAREYYKEYGFVPSAVKRFIERLCEPDEVNWNMTEQQPVKDYELPNPMDVLASPDTYPLPTQPDQLYALLVSVAGVALEDYELWQNAWKVMGRVATQMNRADIAARAASILTRTPKVWRREWAIPNEAIVFVPLLKRAGLI